MLQTQVLQRQEVVARQPVTNEIHDSMAPPGRNKHGLAGPLQETQTTFEPLTRGQTFHSVVEDGVFDYKSVSR